MKRRTYEFTAALALFTIGSGAMSDALVDPTRPMSAHTPSTVVNEAPLKLQAILGADDKFTAIVDGKLVSAGDRIGSAVIDAITADSIRYTRAGRSYAATMAPPSRLDIRPSTHPSSEP